ncbi:MAG: LysR family transcriptional regulator [Pseudomonadota bacterium]
MQKRIPTENRSFDWNQARAFLRSAEAGSFTAAARDEGLTQSTLSRQVAALEEQLGVLLFERAGRSLHLTEPGRELLQHFRAMDDAAREISLGASGRAREIKGRVSIAATDTVSAFLLPAALRRIAAAAPEVTIDLVVADAIVDLGKREADIAIRHSRPTEGHLVARLLRGIPVRLYASSLYLDRIGRPIHSGDLRNATFVGFAPLEHFHLALNNLGFPIDRSQFVVATDNGLVMRELIGQGFGIGVLAQDIGERTPGVERVLPDFDLGALPVWLTTHRELYTSRRNRLVFDILADVLSGTSVREER